MNDTSEKTPAEKTISGQNRDAEPSQSLSRGKPTTATEEKAAVPIESMPAIKDDKKVPGEPANDSGGIDNNEKKQEGSAAISENEERGSSATNEKAATRGNQMSNTDGASLPEQKTNPSAGDAADQSSDLSERPRGGETSDSDTNQANKLSGTKRDTSSEGNDRVTVDEPPKQPLDVAVSQQAESITDKPVSKDTGSSGAVVRPPLEIAAKQPPHTATPVERPPPEIAAKQQPPATTPAITTGPTAATLPSHTYSSTSKPLAEVKPAPGLSSTQQANTVAASSSKPAAPPQSVHKEPPLLPPATAPQLSKQPSAVHSSVPQSQPPKQSEPGVHHSTVAAMPAAKPPPNSSIRTRADTVPNITHSLRSGPSSMERASQQAADEAAIDAARTPLTNLYGQFLCKTTDSTLDDARNRLKEAITQTRMLRHAFTERVYEKYRVCLKPPPETEEILSRIEADPAGRLRELKEQMSTIREEKEIEKKEAIKLNHEMASAGAGRAPVLANVENAEQVMHLTAGLSLVILPEDQADPELLKKYKDRSPVDQTTGQRVRGISQAAATAGEVILDRTRKAAAMRVERQRRRQLQLLRGETEADGEADSNYSRLQVLSSTRAPSEVPVPPASAKAGKPAQVSAPKSQTGTVQRRVASAVSKGGRSRSQTPLSANTLLSLNPSADEVKMARKPCAATEALRSRGVGPAGVKSTQQRLRHPHPDSLGGRRRANVNPPRRDTGSVPGPPEPFLQAYLANTLPPLPAAKERLERKPLVVQPYHTARSETATKSIQSVLKEFVDETDAGKLRPISKIDLLNSVRKLRLEANAEVKSSTPVDGAGKGADQPFQHTSDARESPINPSLTVSVFHALGIISRLNPDVSSPSFKLPAINEENSALNSEKLLSLTKKLTSTDNNLVENVFRPQQEPSKTAGSKRSRNDEDAADQPSGKRTRVEASSSQPVSASSSTAPAPKPEAPAMRIRGGGEVLVDSKEKSDQPKNSADTEKQAEGSSAAAESSSVASTGAPKKRKRSVSSPTRSSSTATGTVQGAAAHPSTGNQTAQSTAHPNAMVATLNMGGQFHHMHHPAAGDLAEYLGSLQQQQHLPGLMSASAQAPFPLGFGQHNAALVGYTLQDRTAAARAMLFREQQAAALLAGYPPPQAVFPQVGSHQAAMSAFLGAQGANALLGPAAITGQAQLGETPQEKVKRSRSTESQGGSKAKKNSNGPESGSERETKKQKAAEPTQKPPEKSEQDKKPPAVDHRKMTGELSAIRNDRRDQHDGMKFFVPQRPEGLSVQGAELIKQGFFHKAISALGSTEHGPALEFLQAIGAAVPIPKGLLLGPLKERLNTPGFKSAGSNSAPPIDRDVVGAAILVWLWANHESTFQKAFDKNGRIDVDQDCKWLVQAATDNAVGELSLEIAESMAHKKGAFAEGAAARKAGAAAQPGPEGKDSQTDTTAVSKKVDICTATVVSRALAVRMRFDEDLNKVIPDYADYVEVLDEMRLGALRAKSQERALLAALLARKTTMSEHFSHAYVSAMVRAGEALGHGKLFEAAQDEEVMSSTMIPYDIFTDDHGFWEDPCKPEQGYTADLAGDELIRRAHARALIQRSLRKLQDRHNVRGGTGIYGPLVEPGSSDASTTRPGVDIRAGGQPSPRPGPRRRTSSMNEPLVAPGTGSATAKSGLVYNPRHFCSPLEWDPDDPDNAPYGAHSRTPRIQSVSLTTGRNTLQPIPKAAESVSAVEPLTPPGTTSALRSTREIEWAEVASTFEKVEVPKKTSRYKGHHHESSIPTDGPIVAPIFRQVEGDLSSDDAESDTEEDLRDATVLGMHQVVLDEMKEKLNAFIEARKKQQELRKSKYSKS